MEVKLNIDFNAGNTRPLAPKARQTPATGPAPDFSRTEGLQQSLSRTADVRPEVVARGAQLAADVSYPPLETVRRIAALLVSHLGKE